MNQPCSGLEDLDRVDLAPPYAAMLAGVTRDMGGHRTWRERKATEARQLLALASIAPRLSVENLCLASELKALLRLSMPVPCRSGQGVLVIAQQALLGLRWPVEVLSRSLAGPSFVQVLLPMGVFHASVAEGPIQALCLGVQLPVGIPVTELVLMSYRAVTLQDHTLDVHDPAGVFRADAAIWWQQNTDRIPLTAEPFLSVAEPAEDAHDA